MLIRDALRRTSIRIAIAAVLAATAVTAGLIWKHKSGPYHLQAVQPGVLYRSGLLRPHNLRRVFEEYRMRTVVSLLPPDTPGAEERLREEARICRESGARFLEMPMPPETPPSPEQLTEWLSLLDNQENHPILVHCKHGVVRTGMMAAVFQIEHLRMDNRDVLSRLPMFGHDLYKPKRKRMPEFILDYTPRWRQRGAPARSATP